MDFTEFLKKLDIKLETYFKSQASSINCKKGCADCCKKGDYPLSDIELKHLMIGFQSLPSDKKIQVQANIKSMKKGEACPFLINDECSIYNYRPIICRVHGLAYLCTDNTVKLPYCTKDGKNFVTQFKNNEFIGQPILENLDTQEILKNFDYGEIRNLYDWCHPTNM